MNTKIKSVLFLVHYINWSTYLIFINARVNTFKTLLPITGLPLTHVAAYYDETELFFYLLQLGFSIRDPSEHNYLPIHYACEGNSLEVATYILNNDPRAVEFDESLRINFINFIINMFMLLFFQMHQRFYKYFLKKGLIFSKRRERANMLFNLFGKQSVHKALIV